MSISSPEGNASGNNPELDEVAFWEEMYRTPSAADGLDGLGIIPTHTPQVSEVFYQSLPLQLWTDPYRDTL